MSSEKLGNQPTVLDELGYPRFSEQELDRRRTLLLDVIAEAGLAGLVVYGEHWTGSAIPWLTEWPTTREAVAVVTPDDQDALFVQHHNHLPQARQLARRCIVHWAGPSTVDTLRDELVRRRLASSPVGWIGPLSVRHARVLAATGIQVVELSDSYTRLRLRKSPEELAWLDEGARHTDAGLLALSRARSGMSEPEIADLIERAYVGQGATTVIHHICATSMAKPDAGVPRQHRSGRRLQPGDVLTAEISAAWWGYSGQVLRTFAVESEPTPLFDELHAVADSAFAAITDVLRAGATAADVVSATSVIEDAGFTVIDDVVHGFGGGYLPPVLGSRSRASGPVPDFTFEPGMAVVVQPNVVTPDWRAGVQTGELLVVTDQSARSLHQVPSGMLRIDGAPGSASTPNQPASS